MMARWAAPRLPWYSRHEKLRRAMRSVRRSVRGMKAMAASMDKAATAVARFNIALAAAMRTATAHLRLENDGYGTEPPPGSSPGKNS